MSVQLYLLDVRQWLEEGTEKAGELPVNEQTQSTRKETEKKWKALACLCTSRAEKVLRARTISGQALSLGAGLLLQYLWEFSDENRHMKDGEAVPIISLTIDELVEALTGKVAVELPLAYRTGGKPYFPDKEFYFSLSHSGHYVLCAVSDREIGADIQQKKEPVPEKLARRVLNEKEFLKFRGLSQEAAADLFYEKWTAGEAYGKLTGEGVFKQLEAQDWSVPENCVCQGFVREDYRICICKWREKDEKAFDFSEGL